MARTGDVRLGASSDLDRLARALRKSAANRDIQRRLYTDLEGAAKPMVSAIKSKVKSLPSKGQNAARGRRSLRSRIARNVRMRTSTGELPGVEVSVDRNALPDGERNLPAYMEGETPFHRWRHPVFGNSSVWVQQDHHDYFYSSAQPYVRDAEKSVEGIVADVAKDIEKGI